MSNAFLRYWRDMAAAGDPNVATPGVTGRDVVTSSGVAEGDECGKDCVDMWPRWGESVGGNGPVPGGVSLDIGRGLHSSTFKLNLSCFCEHIHPTHHLIPPNTP